MSALSFLLKDYVCVLFKMFSLRQSLLSNICLKTCFKRNIISIINKGRFFCMIINNCSSNKGRINMKIKMLIKSIPTVSDKKIKIHAAIVVSRQPVVFETIIDLQSRIKMPTH